MYASVPDSLRKLAKKIGADVVGGDTEDIINAISVKLGGTPVKRKGISSAIDSITEVVDLDIMHNLTTLEVTPSTTAQTIEPESPVDGYSSVSVAAVTAAIDENIVAGNIKKGVQILDVTGSYEGSTVEFNATPAAFTLLTNIRNLDVVIPDGVTSIGNNAFVGCLGLTSVDIPNTVTSIGNDAFKNCSGLASVGIPNFVNSIGSNAFYGCSGLTSVDIPSSVSSIGSGAFYGCTNLAAITIHKAEGSITGAPWGAPNATVVWNG